MKMEPFNAADLDYFPPGEPWSNGPDARVPKFRNIINPADWEGLPVPDRLWTVQDYIPHRNVTILSGDGGIGKSLVAQQLAVARALAREWIGLMPERGRTLILSAEDDADEMHRRLDDIRKFYNAPMVDLSDIRLIDLVGEDSVLGLLMKGQIEPTPMYHMLDAYTDEFKPSLIILDVLADMFSGDENSRTQSRQFGGLLKRLCKKHDCATLLLTHPSLTGINSGTGSSGSTGWNNTSRSRLYLQTTKASDGSEPNPNMRTLQGMKSNYGVRGGKIDLEWKNGLLVPVKVLGGVDKMAADAKIDDAFLTLLKRFNAQGRNAADRKGTSYAPALFSEEPDNQGFGKKQFEDSMRRLFKDSKIHIVDIGRKSKPSRTIMPVET